MPFLPFISRRYLFLNNLMHRTDLKFHIGGKDRYKRKHDSQLIKLSLNRINVISFQQTYQFSIGLRRFQIPCILCVSNMRDEYIVF
jgi:hypothetical protein